MDGALKGQALLCVKNWDVQQKMIRTLESLAYQTIIPTSTGKVLEQIKGAPYKVIVLEDTPQEIPLAENPIYQAVVQMPMILRRSTFFMLLSKGVKSLDPMFAFSMSANLLLDMEQIPEEKELAATLQKKISEYDKFYQVLDNVKEQISQGK